MPELRTLAPGVEVPCVGMGTWQTFDSGGAGQDVGRAAGGSHGVEAVGPEAVGQFGDVGGNICDRAAGTAGGLAAAGTGVRDHAHPAFPQDLEDRRRDEPAPRCSVVEDHQLAVIGPRRDGVQHPTVA